MRQRLVNSLVVLCACTLGGCGSLVSSVSHKGKVSSSIQATNAAVDLDISTKNGNVIVKLDPDSDEIALQVSLTAGGASEQEAKTRYDAALKSAKAILNNGTLSVQLKFPQPRYGNDGADITLVLPQIKGARVQTSNGDVEIDSAKGEIAIITSNGDVTISKSTGKINIDTSNGDVDVELLDSATGPVTINTSNSSVSLSVGSAFAGSITMSTSNAGVTLVDPGKRAKSSSIDRSDGSIDLGKGPKSIIDTSNGPITVTLR